MRILPWLIIVLALIALILFAADQVNQSAAHRLAAEAAVIRAQSQARLDATSAYLPYVVIATSVAFGSAIIALGVAVLFKLNQPAQAPQILERHIIVMIAPPEQQSRRAMWEQLGANLKPRLE